MVRVRIRVNVALPKMLILPGYHCAGCRSVAQCVTGDHTASGYGAWPGDSEGGAGGVAKLGAVGRGRGTLGEDEGGVTC